MIRLAGLRSMPGMLVAASLLWGRVAGAEIDSALVREGLAAFEALDYARAAELLEKARGERLTVEELTATLRTLGIARLALGDEPGASVAFVALLREVPDATLDRALSPHIRAVFDEARARVAADRAREESAAAARATVAPPARRDDRPPPAERPPAETPPAAASQAPAPALALVSTAPAIAVRRPVPAPAPPVWRRAWFWGILGGVAAAAVVAGVTAGVLTRDGTLVVVPR